MSGKSESFDPRDNCILYGFRGSIAHNLFVPSGEMATDDRDYMGVCICPVDYYLGIKKFEQYQSMVGKNDIIIYDIRKFFSLLMKCNPNVLSFMFNERRMIPDITNAGQVLLDNVDMFLCAPKVYKAFAGYAKSQIKKMESGVGYQGYMGEKRKKLYDRFGYDTKNAAHLIRLLKMGIELLSTGNMQVYRVADRSELLAIKEGLWSIENVKAKAKNLFEALRLSLETTVLPPKQNLDDINNLLIDILCAELEVNNGY